MCWLLTEGDGRRDGEFRKYLKDPERWRRFDPELYERLSQLIRPGVHRSVLNAKSWNLLPRASYYAETVTGNREQRRSYFDEALRQLGDTDLLFFDPDNGIEVPSAKYGTKKSPKYVYWCEVEEAYARGHSMIIYQHFPRKPRDEFVATKIEELRIRFPEARLGWFRTANVVFLAAFRSEHSEALGKASVIVGNQWRGQIWTGDLDMVRQ